TPWRRAIHERLADGEWHRRQVRGDACTCLTGTVETLRVLRLSLKLRRQCPQYRRNDVRLSITRLHDRRGHEASALSVADVDGRSTQRGSLEDAAGRIADNRRGKPHQAEITRSTERVHEYAACRSRGNEPIDERHEG